MRILLVVLTLFHFLTPGLCQTASESAAAKAQLLSLDQKMKIAHQIVKNDAARADNGFSIAVDRVVPAEIPVQPLPSEAENVAPQVRGFGYIIVGEEIALVDQRTRRIEVVFQRWGGQ
jgi:hypothetical protein